MKKTQKDISKKMNDNCSKEKRKDKNAIINQAQLSNPKQVRESTPRDLNIEALDL